MWLPRTSRTPSEELIRATLRMISSTHGPPALTSARARCVARPCVPSVVSTHRSPCRSAVITRVRVMTRAPRSAASRAFRATSRESSTQQSEYSKARRYSGFSGLPAGSVVRSRLRAAGRIFRPPIVSYISNPNRISQAGRRPRAQGITQRSSREVGVSDSNRMPGDSGRTNRIGQLICGMATSNVSRSSSASRTSRNSKYSRYRNPP